MANERRGNLSEACVVAALQHAGHTLGVDLHWHQTPKVLSVCDSDVTLGPQDTPNVLFQVCSSGYEGGYQKKFWRDMGELFDVRVKLPACKVFSLVFEPGVKPRLTQVYDRLAEGVLMVAELPCGGELLALTGADAARAKVPPTFEGQLAWVRERLSASALSCLARALAGLVARPKVTWSLASAPAGTSAVAEDLNFRSAFLTALLFTERGSLRSATGVFEAIAKEQPISRVPHAQSLVDLELIRPWSGFLNRDANLRKCIVRLGVEEFCELGDQCLSANPKSRIVDYLDTIHHLPSLTPAWHRAICAHMGELMEPSSLARLLVANSADRTILLPPDTAGINEPWLFRRLLDAVRAVEEKHFAIGIPRFDALAKERGVSPFRFAIPEYVAGRKPLSPRHAALAAELLVAEFRRIKLETKFPKKLDRFGKEVRRSEFQQRLLTYRGFDPLPVILEKRFGIQGDTFLPNVIRSLGVSGAATCAGAIEGGILYMWQGASKEGVAHKVKENVGRMGLCALRARPLADGLGFEWNPDIRERVLFVDGDWGELQCRAVTDGGIVTRVQRLL